MESYAPSEREIVESSQPGIPLLTPMYTSSAFYLVKRVLWRHPSTKFAHKLLWREEA
jgi:hypothetical protein